MIDFVKLSRERYHTDLEAKRKLKDEEKAMKQIQSEKHITIINAAKQREDESNKLCNAILQVKPGLTVADEIVEGNKQLKELLTKKMLLGMTSKLLNPRLKQALTGRKELLEQLAVLNKRKKEVEMEG